MTTLADLVAHAREWTGLDRPSDIAAAREEMLARDAPALARRLASGLNTWCYHADPRMMCAHISAVHDAARAALDALRAEPASESRVDAIAHLLGELAREESATIADLASDASDRGAALLEAAARQDWPAARALAIGAEQCERLYRGSIAPYWGPVLAAICRVNTRPPRPRPRAIPRQ